MKFLRLLTLFLLELAILGALVPVLIPSLSGRGLENDYLAVGIFFSMMGLGAAALFWVGLRGFKPEFKRAYGWLCWGVVIHAVGWSIPVFLTYAPSISPFYTPLLADLPYLVGTLLIYISVWRFARIVGIDAWMFRLRVVGPAFIGLLLVSAFLPYPATNMLLPRSLPSTINLGQAAADVLCVLALWRLRVAISRGYVQAISWLFVTMLLDLLGSATYFSMVIAGLYSPANDEVGVAQALLAFPYTLHNLLFIVCAYAFARITRAAERLPENVTVVDVITDTAQLVSVPSEEFQALLNPLRTMTAGRADRGHYSKTELEELATIYESIERYLIEKDPLRSFTQEGLRRRIRHRFEPACYEPLLRKEGQ